MAKFLEELAVGRLASTAVSISGTTKQTLYTVPSGYKAVVLAVVARDASATAATGVGGFGGNANANDFVASKNFTNLNGVDPVHIEFQRDASNATPPAAVTYPAGTVFGVKMGTGVAATVTFDVIGYLIAV